MPAVPVGIAAGRQLAALRVSLAGLPVQPYFWMASAGEVLHDWHRILGLESGLDLGSLTVARLPAVRLHGGLAYSLDAPFAHHTRAYLVLGYRP